MNKYNFAAIFLMITTLNVFSGSFSQQDTLEVYVIDNYVTPEVPHKLIISFFTSDVCKSKLKINDNIEVVVSDEFSDNHKIQLDLSGYKLYPKGNYFVIIVEDEAGKIFSTEKDDFDIAEDKIVEGGSNFLTFCLFGGVVFALPSPAYVIAKEDKYFSLTKEIPLIFLSSGGYNYPAGYLGVEYSHIFNSPVKNFFRTGYKHIIEIPTLEYVSPGINYVTNFKGFNGIGPEISIGLFRIFNTFTVFSRYRFSAKPGEPGSEFHEISIGLYSGFFAVYF